MTRESWYLSPITEYILKGSLKKSKWRNPMIKKAIEGMASGETAIGAEMSLG